MFGWGCGSDVFYLEDLLNEYRSVAVQGVNATLEQRQWRCTGRYIFADQGLILSRL